MSTDWSALHGQEFAGRGVLVTGGAGFIGAHLASALAALGARVTVIDDLCAGSAANVPPGARFVLGSVLDPAAIEAALTPDTELVFHEAALGSVPRSVEQPELYQRVNVDGTLAVLRAAHAARARRVVFAASSSAYGDTDELPKHEGMPPRPLSPYAANKVAGEALMRAFSGSYGLDTVSLRYFNIFGPRQNANSAYAAVIAAFASALLGNVAPVIYGDGSQSRDFTHVDNAVHANLLAASRPGKLAGECFNVATGTRITVSELATTMARLLGREHLVPEHRPPRAGDVLHSQASLTRARAALGYSPLVNLEDGLRETLAWYREQLAS